MPKKSVMIILLVLSTFKVVCQSHKLCEVLLNEEYIVPSVEEDSFGLNYVNSIGELFAYSDFLPLAQLIGRAQFLAKAKIESGSAILLTYGTNGDCGLGELHYHEVTQKHEFNYLCVGSSCTLRDIPVLVKAYNDISIKFLNSINSSWRKEVDNELWFKYITSSKIKRTKKEKDLIGSYRDERGNTIELLVDSFHFEHRLDMGYGYSNGVWRLENDTIKFYVNTDADVEPIQQIYFEKYIENLFVVRHKLFRLNDDGTLQDRKVKSVLSSKSRKKENFYRKLKQEFN